MFDKDLAELYQVKPIRIREQVKRNIERFPSRFMFQLTLEEIENLRSQSVITKEKVSHFAIPSNQQLGGSLPYVFTEQGVAMLSSVLRSKVAITVSLQIIDTFVELRKIISNNFNINNRLDHIESKQLIHDKNFKEIFSKLENNNINLNK